MTNEAYAAVLDQVDQECLEHHGILGMKWGIRRYQNPDGTLTKLGKKHLEDGKTQKVIEKWNSKKSNAIAKGNDKFVKKNIDYFSNDEINNLKTRVEAKTSISDLQQASRRVTEEKLRSWSNMMQSVANGARNAIDIYNAAVKVNNSLFGGKMKQIKDSENIKEGIQEINETFKNGVLESRTTRSQDANGVKTNKTENFGEDPNRDRTEFVNTVYDSNNQKTQEVKQYYKDGVRMKDTRNFTSSNNDSKDSSNKGNEPDNKPTNPSPKLPVPTGGGSGNASTPKRETAKQEAPKKTSNTYSNIVMAPGSNLSKKSSKVERVEGEVVGTGSSKFKSKSNVKDAESYVPITNKITQQSTTGTSLVPSYWGGNSSGNSSKSSSSSSSTGGFKGFKNNMSPNASKAVKDVDDYTDELFKILNGKGYI